MKIRQGSPRTAAARAALALGAAAAAVAMTGAGVHAATPSAAHAAHPADTAVTSPFDLDAGQTIRNGAYRLDMQSDCNLVLYKDQTALWSSGTANRAPAWSCRMVFQSDAHLVVYSGGAGEQGQVVWASDRYVPGFNAVFRLVLQDDGNLVIYDTNKAVIWSTSTNGR